MFCRNCGKEFKELAGKPDICANCGARALAHTSFCPQCSSPTNANAVVCVKCGASLEPVIAQVVPAVEAQKIISKKSRLVVVILCFFLGGLGAHRFYVGRIVTGIVMLLGSVIGILGVEIFVGFIPLAAVAVWAIGDFLKALTGHMKDKEGKLITRWSK